MEAVRTTSLLPENKTTPTRYAILLIFQVAFSSLKNRSNFFFFFLFWGEIQAWGRIMLNPRVNLRVLCVVLAFKLTKLPVNRKIIKADDLKLQCRVLSLDVVIVRVCEFNLPIYYAVCAQGESSLQWTGKCSMPYLIS